MIVIILSMSDVELYNLAKKSISGAYIPEGRTSMRIGAIIETMDGQIFTGSNIKLSCGLDICAERLALYKALEALGPKLRIKNVAISLEDDKAINPCGVCRESIWPFITSQSRLIHMNDKSTLMSTEFKSLMPIPFKENKNL